MQSQCNGIIKQNSAEDAFDSKAKRTPPDLISNPVIKTRSIYKLNEVFISVIYFQMRASCKICMSSRKQRSQVHYASQVMIKTEE
ncbi:hypothetical protein CDL12_05204 [Handroanthus impetiginosus]|uniref:Uncharacterized protein n=1 Tax=Handroanthus impetiginosus TaxID=429701 RepID=A0A2G9HX48_9LAMI|nr:hypothetical protein CDL12_05204 [Handroanthus impetiginosus]